MKEAIEEARKTMNLNYGGPFGAMITKDNKIIAIASNTVLKDNDPTAHAEINAIRKAGEYLILMIYQGASCMQQVIRVLCVYQQ